MKLYRPVGLAEFRLIAELNWRAFPPRLPIQPIFYPVLNPEYATHIAQQWNVADPVSGFCGFVLRFEIDDAFVARYPIQVVGGRVHQELWVPAEEIDEFNAHILAPIGVTTQFYGEKFEGKTPDFFTQAKQQPLNNGRNSSVETARFPDLNVSPENPHYVQIYSGAPGASRFRSWFVGSAGRWNIGARFCRARSQSTDLFGQQRPQSPQYSARRCASRHRRARL